MPENRSISHRVAARDRALRLLGSLKRRLAVATVALGALFTGLSYAAFPGRKVTVRRTAASSPTAGERSGQAGSQTTEETTTTTTTAQTASGEGEAEAEAQAPAQATPQPPAEPPTAAQPTAPSEPAASSGGS